MGVRVHRSDGLWYREPMHHSIYATAFVLSRQADYPAMTDEIEAMITRFPSEWVHLYESFDELDLRPLGFEQFRNEVWMWSESGDLPDDKPRELTIERVTTRSGLEEFVDASMNGMEVEGRMLTAARTIFTIPIRSTMTVCTTCGASRWTRCHKLNRVRERHGSRHVWSIDFARIPATRLWQIYHSGCNAFRSKIACRHHTISRGVQHLLSTRLPLCWRIQPVGTKTCISM